jgi:hypothetical protein
MQEVVDQRMPVIAKEQKRLRDEVVHEDAVSSKSTRNGTGGK